MPTAITNPAQVRAINFLKNPNFAVIQGAASGSLVNSIALPTATLGYSGETEWWMSCITSNLIPTYAISSLNELVIFTGALGTTAIYLGQRLESRDTNRLKNKTITISAEISNSLSLPVTWEIRRPTTTADTHGTINVSTQTLVSSGTWNTTSTATRYNATIVLPSQVDLGLEVRIYVGSQTSGTWTIGKLQLEEGTVATNFSCDNFTIELAKCRRYFQWVQFNSYFTATAVSQVKEDWQSFSTPLLLLPIISTPTVDPASSAIAVNATSANFVRITPNGVAAQLVSSASGDSIFVGYRSSASAHIL